MVGVQQLLFHFCFILHSWLMSSTHHAQHLLDCASWQFSREIVLCLLMKRAVAGEIELTVGKTRKNTVEYSSCILLSFIYSYTLFSVCFSDAPAHITFTALPQRAQAFLNGWSRHTSWMNSDWINTTDKPLRLSENRAEGTVCYNVLNDFCFLWCTVCITISS